MLISGDSLCSRFTWSVGFIFCSPGARPKKFEVSPTSEAAFSNSLLWWFYCLPPRVFLFSKLYLIYFGGCAVFVFFVPKCQNSLTVVGGERSDFFLNPDLLTLKEGRKEGRKERKIFKPWCWKCSHGSMWENVILGQLNIRPIFPNPDWVVRNG